MSRQREGVYVARLVGQSWRQTKLLSIVAIPTFQSVSPTHDPVKAAETRKATTPTPNTII